MSTAARAAALAQGLAQNATLTNELCDILGNFDQRMGRLEEAILPVQARKRSRRRSRRFLVSAHAALRRSARAR